jgi:hypothetical protein
MMASGPRVGVVHVHSRYSHDGRDSPADLGRFMRSRGIGFLGLTDHAEDLDAGRWAELVADCGQASDADARIIPGLEFRFEGYPGLHLLALGLKDWIEPRTPGEFTDHVRGRAGLTIMAHPGLARYDLPPEVETEIDAIEVWNGAFNTRYLPDPQAIRLLRGVRQRRPSVVGIAGLDQHDARNDRELRLLLAADTSDPLGQLRAGRFRNHGRFMTFGSALDWPAVGLAGFTVVRGIFDRVERIQDRAARRRLARRTPR